MTIGNRSMKLQRFVPSPAYLQAALGVFFAASIALLFLFDLQMRYREAIADGKKTLLNFSEILAEQTALSFESIESTLREAAKIRQDSLSGKYATTDATNAALRLLKKTSPIVVAVGWTDASGNLIAHSYDHEPPRTNIAGMAHFTEQRDSSDDRMYIAPPYRSAANNKWYTAASRRLQNADGTFAGIVTAPVDQSYFSRIYRSIDLGRDGTVLLLHKNGQLLAREPALESAIGKSFASGALLTTQLPRSEAGTYETVSAMDGVERVAGYKAVRGLPLVILVSYARAGILESWYRHIAMFGPVVVVIVAAILFGTFLLVRQTRSLAEKSAVMQRQSREIAQINQRFDVALANMSSGLCMFDANHQLVFANDRFGEMYGLTREQVKPGMHLRQLLQGHVENGEGAGIDMDNYIRAVLSQPTQIGHLADGRTTFIRRKATPEGGWIATHEDITEEKKTEAALIENAKELEMINSRFDAAINTMSQGFCLFDAAQRVVVSNRRYSEIYNLDPGLIKTGTTLREILEYRHQKGTGFGPAPDIYITQNLKENSEVHELADGRIVSINRHSMPNGGWLTTHEDITDRAKSERKIAFLAQHDLLTGLPNRAFFTQKLREASQRNEQRRAPFSVFMLDLDKFKQVNDTLGHPAGDQLLIQVAQRLKSSIRNEDVVARLGGDEFAIIQHGERNQSEAAVALAHRIIGIIGEPFDLNGNDGNIGTSIGIVFAPGDGGEPDDLMKKADLALYAAKSEGRNDFRLFRPEMMKIATIQKTMENELSEAISSGQFELHYQPIVTAQSREICGVEALIRWRHPLKGLVPPDQFIPLAETTGLMLPIGDWVLQQACKDAVSFPPHVKVAINLSAAQFNKGNLFDVVLCALIESGLPPDRLELEITESVLLENHSAHLLTIRQLKNLGVTLVLDDFGTGYSSASYVTRFPFDKIKIDKSFVQGATHRTDCAAVVASVLALARGLGIKTTAEGIETEQQREYMRDVGVDLVQGYLFGRPVLLEQLDFAGRTDLDREVA